MDLLLAHGDDGSPILGRAVDARAAGGGAAPQPVHESRFLSDITADANDLVRQRWALVVPEGDERLAAAVQALVRLRAEEQGDDVLVLRAPVGLDSAAAAAWTKDAVPAAYGGDEARRPRYLMILGDLDRVSLETQQVLGRDGLVGRLACNDDAGYAAYAEKVIAAQRARSERARALLYTVHDGTAATTAGHAKLIEPCRKLCALATERRTFAAAIDARGADEPDPSELLGLAASDQPSVLLSMSHGAGPPRRRLWTPDEARLHQGAMSFGGAGALEAADLASAPFLPGGVWIYFACFGAGTPSGSAYRHWLELLAQSGMSDVGQLGQVVRGLDQSGGFVSGLAKAALANPRGPLAILGHVDLAWSYSYEELRVAGDRRIVGSNRALNFFNLMTKLVAGERAGAACLALALQIGSVAAELAAHYDRCKRAGGVEGGSPAELLALGNLWMLHQDLAGYALLGDPAVRLPIGAAQPARETVRPADSPLIGSEAVERLEAAAIEVIREASPAVIAETVGLLRSEMVEAARAYQDAGRAALAAFLARLEQEKGR